MAVHRRCTPGLVDEGADVFYLALDHVRRGVAAVAPAPAVVVEHGEMLRQLLGGRAHQSPVAHRPAHQDDRRTLAQPVEGDGGAVGRSDLPERIAHRHRPPSRTFAFSLCADRESVESAGGLRDRPWWLSRPGPYLRTSALTRPLRRKRPPHTSTPKKAGNRNQGSSTRTWVATAPPR